MKPLTIGEASTVILGLQDEIRRSSDSRYDHRVHGVLLVAQGMNCGQVARLLGDGVSTVQSWVHRFEREGLAGLSEGMRPGRPSCLKPEQLGQIERALRQRPCDFGLNGNLWDGKTLSAHIKRHHGMKMGARQCCRLFHRLEFRLRKPRPVIAPADPKKRAEHEQKRKAYKKTPYAGRRYKGWPVGFG